MLLVSDWIQGWSEALVSVTVFISCRDRKDEGLVAKQEEVQGGGQRVPAGLLRWENVRGIWS